MSDWKSRATPVTEDQSTESWKSRATALDIPERKTFKQEAIDDAGLLGESVKHGITDLGKAATIAADAALMNGGDEIIGGLSAGKDLLRRLGHKALPGVIDDSQSHIDALQADPDAGVTTNLGEVYRKAQEAADKEKQRISTDVGPIASTGSAIGGSLLPLLSGVGSVEALPGFLKSIPGIGKAISGAEAIKAARLGETTGAAAKAALLGSKATVAAAEGAPVGAAFGALDSKAHLSDDPGQVVSDALHGAETGSVAGVTLNVAPELAKLGAGKLSNSLGSSNAAQRIKKAFEFGSEEGKSLFGHKDKSALTRDKQYASDLTDRIQAGRTKLGQDIGSSIDKATQAGVQIPNDRNLVSLADNLSATAQNNPAIRDDASKIVDVMRQGKSMTPDEARTNIQRVNEIMDKLGGDTADNTVRSVLQQYQQGLDRSLKTAIPEYAQAAQRYAQFMQSVPESLIAGSKPVDLAGFRFGDLNKADLKLDTAATDAIKGASAPGDSEGYRKFLALKNGLNDVSSNEDALIKAGKLTPEQSVFNATGTPDSIVRNIADQSNEVNMLRKGFSDIDKSPHGSNILTSLLGMGESTMLKAANTVGRVQRSIANPIASKGQALSSATEETLRGVAAKLRSSGKPGTSHLADNLERAVQNKDQTAKNAAIFSIMQNPNSRQNLSDEDK